MIYFDSCCVEVIKTQPFVSFMLILFNVSPLDMGRTKLGRVRKYSN